MLGRQSKTISNADLDEIKNLQPEGWPDIVPEFELYIKNSFCHAIKIEADDRLVGIGASVSFPKTSWLAHIIVDRDYRKKGIGFQIVEELLKSLNNRSIKTCLLLATDLGLTIYKKAGFRSVTEYVYLKREKSWKKYPLSDKLIPYRDKYYPMLMRLDRTVSGEDREILLKNYLGNSIIYLNNKKVMGYYMPGIGEGTIIAESEEAGLELMKLKLSKIDKCVLPSDNVVGIDFIKQNGFTESDTKGTRMILGTDIKWKPENIYSRIGGNYG